MMMIKHELNPKKFLEPLQYHDGYSEANFLFNYQLLKEEYRNNGLLVNHYSFGEIALQFMKTLHASYFEQGFLSATEIRQSVDYIANELLENSIKYSDETATKINLKIHVNKQRIIVESTNLISKNRSETFLNYLQNLMYSDPSELYIRQLEKNSSDNNKSGLGLLSMIHDYRAEINWKFTSTELNHSVLSCIIVRLPTKFI
ncbi:MAG: DUF6272 family protein [Synechococcus sp.]